MFATSMNYILLCNYKYTYIPLRIARVDHELLPEFEILWLSRSFFSLRCFILSISPGHFTASTHPRLCCCVHYCCAYRVLSIMFILLALLSMRCSLHHTMWCTYTKGWNGSITGLHRVSSTKPNASFPLRHARHRCPSLRCHCRRQPSRFSLVNRCEPVEAMETRSPVDDR